MQKQFNEDWYKFVQFARKPMLDMLKLNMHTLNNLSKNTTLLHELSVAQKPEDLLWTQIKLANMGHLEAVSYAKKVGEIWTGAMTEINDIYIDMLHKTATKTTGLIKSKTIKATRSSRKKAKH